MVRLRPPQQSTFQLRRPGTSRGKHGGKYTLDQLVTLGAISFLSLVVLAYIMAFSLLSTSSTSPTANGAAIKGALDEALVDAQSRQMGISPQLVRKRGGGRRIFPKMSEAYNVLALDVMQTLHCEELQRELDDEWASVLKEDDKAREEQEKYKKEWGQDWNNEGGGGGSGDFGGAGGGDDGEVGGGDGPPPPGDDAVRRRRRRRLAEAEMQKEQQLASSKSGQLMGGRRRLDDFENEEDAAGDAAEEKEGGDDFWKGGNNAWSSSGDSYSSKTELKLNGQHLLCLAAGALTLPTLPEGYNIKQGGANTDQQDEEQQDAFYNYYTPLKQPSFSCDASNSKRETLLDLWSALRAQVPNTSVLLKSLELATESSQNLREHKLTSFWSPKEDTGTEFILNELNAGYSSFLAADAEEGGDNWGQDVGEVPDLTRTYAVHDLPSKYTGPNSLFVDVGSNLGLTTLLAALLYPETTIVSIEPASPSYIMQQLNLRCNLDSVSIHKVHPILAGIGSKHHDDDNSMMKLLWRPSATTSSRSWNPESEYDPNTDLELVVRLRTLRSVLAEATPDDLPLGTPISVLNLDCQGCEYNLIPSMHDQSFESVGIVLGRIHWGHIPTVKKPSSERARKTHERLCKHPNFAIEAKECCAFPQLLVRPRLFGLEGKGSKAGTTETVSSVAGSLCDGFENWAKEAKLYDIPDDYGWFDMSAVSPVDNELPERR